MSGFGEDRNRWKTNSRHCVFDVRNEMGGMIRNMIIFLSRDKNWCYGNSLKYVIMRVTHLDVTYSGCGDKLIANARREGSVLW